MTFQRLEVPNRIKHKQTAKHHRRQEKPTYKLRSTQNCFSGAPGPEPESRRSSPHRTGNPITSTQGSTLAGPSIPRRRSNVPNAARCPRCPWAAPGCPWPWRREDREGRAEGSRRRRGGSPRRRGALADNSGASGPQPGSSPQRPVQTEQMGHWEKRAREGEELDCTQPTPVWNHTGGSQRDMN